MNTRKLKIAVVSAVVLLGSVFTVSAFAQTEDETTTPGWNIEISGNAGTSGVSVNVNNNTVVTQSNTSNVSNNISVNGNTGGNNTNNNTGGSTSITTGAVSTVITITNTVGSNIANLFSGE